MNLKYNLFAVVLTAIMISCDSENGIQDLPETTIELSRSEIESVDNISNFSLRIFEDVVENQSEFHNKNFAIAPFNLATSLAMVANASDQQNKQEIFNVFEISDGGLIEMNELFGKLIGNLPTMDPKSELILANSVWTDSENPIPEWYIDDMWNVYGAPVTKIDDFLSDDNVNLINQWINDATNNMIDFKIEYSTSIDSMFNLKRFEMLSAMYFKGQWRQAFKKEATSQKKFYNIDNTTSTVPMMKGKINGGYVITNQYVAVRIPYGNNSFALNLFEAHNGNSMSKLIHELANGEWNAYLRESTTSQELSIQIPRFEIESEIDFCDILENNGIDFKRKDGEMGCQGIKLFDDDRNFIFNTTQNTKIKVDEDGTSAASVTAASGKHKYDGANGIGHVFDHPFIFVLSERSTGAILVAGCVNKL